MREEERLLGNGEGLDVDELFVEMESSTEKNETLRQMREQVAAAEAEHSTEVTLNHEMAEVMDLLEQTRDQTGYITVGQGKRKMGILPAAVRKDNNGGEYVAVTLGGFKVIKTNFFDEVARVVRETDLKGGVIVESDRREAIGYLTPNTANVDKPTIRIPIRFSDKYARTTKDLPFTDVTEETRDYPIRALEFSLSARFKENSEVVPVNTLVAREMQSLLRAGK